MDGSSIVGVIFQVLATLIGIGVAYGALKARIGKLEDESKNQTQAIQESQREFTTYKDSQHEQFAAVRREMSVGYVSMEQFRYLAEMHKETQRDIKELLQMVSEIKRN